MKEETRKKKKKPENKYLNGNSKFIPTDNYFKCKCAKFSYQNRVAE